VGIANASAFDTYGEFVMNVIDNEMWTYLARQEHKTLGEVKGDHAYDTPEDLKELKAYVLSERRNDAIEEKTDCYTLGVHVARHVVDALSDACWRGKHGRLVYRDGWSDERVVRSVTEPMANIVKRIREDFEGSPLIDRNRLPLNFPDKFRLP
jgi:hypothetical protein